MSSADEAPIYRWCSPAGAASRELHLADGKWEAHQVETKLKGAMICPQKSEGSVIRSGEGSSAFDSTDPPFTCTRLHAQERCDQVWRHEDAIDLTVHASAVTVLTVIQPPNSSQLSQ